MKYGSPSGIKEQPAVVVARCSRLEGILFLTRENDYEFISQDEEESSHPRTEEGLLFLRKAVYLGE